VQKASAEFGIPTGELSENPVGDRV